MNAPPTPAMTINDVPVYFGDVAGLPDVLSNDYSSVHILADAQTMQFCAPALRSLSWPAPAHWIAMHAGEEAKNLDTCLMVWRQLTDQGADRHSLVVNLGGGVVTDLGGFCAATYLRGIRFLHISTSVLGMVDAAIGGKHGVDLDGLKNYVGVFASPQLVWIDPAFLKTLPDRHVRNGLAEVIKHGCVGDPDLLAMIHGDLSGMAWDDLLLQSVQVKKQFVEADPAERGIRAALNFGHTIGHALETFALETGYDLLHGEAVALGMLAESQIAREVAGLPDAAVDRINTAVRQVFPELGTPAIPPEVLLELIGKDKKRRSGHVHFALISALGVPSIGHQVAPDLIRRMLSYDS
ncbi:MAG: 3-dehydroquinate synthase [Saprospiraceae bacterium]|nr:3-dehydroquinate synthase [Saprospiraceae bacterium]